MIRNVEKYELVIWDELGLEGMDEKRRVGMVEMVEER